MSNKIIELQNNPLIFHPPLSIETNEFREQRKINILFKLNLRKLAKQHNKKTVYLTKEFNLFY